MFYRPHQRVLTPVGTESMTKQAHKDECDINKILSQYKKTGMINHIQSKAPVFVDLPSDIDYQTALNTVLTGENAFASLPSLVRDEFRNDPMVFLQAFVDPARRSRLEELGFFKPSAKPVKEGQASAGPSSGAEPPPAGGAPGATP